MLDVALTCIFDKTLQTKKIDNSKSFNFKTILNFLKIAYSNKPWEKDHEYLKLKNYQK